MNTHYLANIFNNLLIPYSYKRLYIVPYIKYESHVMAHKSVQFSNFLFAYVNIL